MTKCRVCGTVTGMHGFSFSKQAIAAQAQESKKQAGILYIPREFVPLGENEDEFLENFLAEINDSLTRPCAPEVRWSN